MSKLIIEVKLFQKLLDTFFKAKVDNKEDKFKDALKKQSPELGAAFDEYDKQLISNSEKLKQRLKGTGIDTSKMDYWTDQLKKLS